jgi:hypothetical protein
MLKKRKISVYSDLKTGFFCKFFLFLGLILLIFYIIQRIIPLIAVKENILGIILAFSILFLGTGIIVYFFNCQFAKLAEIANEIEHGEESENLKKEKNKEKR